MARKLKRGLKMNGYKCFYKNQSIEVYASTTFEAQKIAAQKLRAKKSYEVTVILCEKSGQQYTQAATF